MGKIKHISLSTHGEKFYDITEEIKSIAQELAQNSPSGNLYVLCQHTSCGLVISENYDSSAKRDLEKFMRHLAPRDLAFIEHTSEGPDDSPSHMKSILTQPQLVLFVEEGEVVLGTWQGVFLAEFRDSPKKRNVILKYVED